MARFAAIRVSFASLATDARGGELKLGEGELKLSSALCGAGAGLIGAGSFAGVVCSFHIAIVRYSFYGSRAGTADIGSAALSELYHSTHRCGTTRGKSPARSWPHFNDASSFVARTVA